jgi:hypothetical protein
MLKTNRPLIQNNGQNLWIVFNNEDNYILDKNLIEEVFYQPQKAKCSSHQEYLDDLTLFYYTNS